MTQNWLPGTAQLINLAALDTHWWDSVFMVSLVHWASVELAVTSGVIWRFRVFDSFQKQTLTPAGVSVSLIGCPSNLNLICLIESPCRHKHILMNKRLAKQKTRSPFQSLSEKRTWGATLAPHSKVLSPLLVTTSKKKLHSCTSLQEVAWERTSEAVYLPSADRKDEMSLVIKISSQAVVQIESCDSETTDT